MKSSSLRPAALLGVSLALAACSAHDGSSLQLPTSHTQSGTSPVQSGVAVLPPSGESAGGVEMQAASVGPPPPGFKLVIRSKPRPGMDGVLNGETPFTVEFDLCDSTADADKTLHYWYDWDFNHIADAGGTGAACKQEHIYRVKPVDNAKGDETIRTNICVADGDIRLHDPKTFVACREFTVVTPIPVLQTGFAHHTGYGQTWLNDVPTGTFNLSQAALTCQQYVDAVEPGLAVCHTTGCGCSNGSLCTYEDNGFKVWFYSGGFVGNTTPNSCSTGLAWD